jgi:hypothetical protein
MSDKEWQNAVDSIHNYKKKYHLELKIIVFPRDNYTVPSGSSARDPDGIGLSK